MSTIKANIIVKWLDWVLYTDMYT